ncbi:hypothetical protein [Flagellimonas sp.]|uniref:hypothetical protein n=1 Tax=Flagellimonas sp. TaxID=2058762 RepID=UPI003B5B62F3
MSGTLSYIDNFLGNIFERIKRNSAVDTQSLAYFRIFIGIFMLAHYLPEWIWFGDAPQGFFQPHMFTAAYLWDGFWDKSFYVLLDSLNILLFIMVTLGIRTRVSFLLLFIINYIGYSFEFSFGKIDHEIHLFLIVLITCVFTNIGTKSAFLKDKKINPNVQKWALALLSIYIAFGFFTAGLPKFLRWVDFNANEIGFLDWFYKGFFTYDRSLLLAKSVFKTPYIVFEIADHLAPTIELISFVFLLGSKRAWRIYLVILCFFHMGNTLLLNIEFALNITCYGIFLIGPVLSHFKSYFPKGRKAKNMLLGLVAVLAIYQVGKRIYYWDYTYEVGYYSEKFIVDSNISIVMWIITILMGFYTIRKKLYENPQTVKSLS